MDGEKEGEQELDLRFAGKWGARVGIQNRGSRGGGGEKKVWSSRGRREWGHAAQSPAEKCVYVAGRQGSDNSCKKLNQSHIVIA